MMKKVYLLLGLCLLVGLTYAQGPDCTDALVICDDGQVAFNPSGAGINDFASPNNSNGCLSSLENQSAWYYFEMNPDTPPGTALGFTINPNGGSGEDYDFAIYGPNVDCDNLGFPVRCSYASSACGQCPQTGLGNGASDTSEGAGGDGYVANLSVNPGDGFYLVVDNWLGSSTGFNLDWTGPGAPFLNCDANPTCSLEALPVSDVTVCQGATPFQLPGGSIGGLGAVLYSWNGDAGGTAFLDNPSSPTPTVTLPPDFNGTITYTLLVSEGSCMDMINVIVTVNAPPTVEILPAGPFCADDTPQILVANPMGGTWGGAADPFGQIDPGVLGVGPHTITYDYTDEFGCSNSASIDIVVQESPLVTILGDLDFCIGDGFTVLDAIGSLGDGNYTYVWDTPIGPTSGGSIIASVPGIYSVTVQDGNTCTGEEMVQVTILPEPDVLIFPPGPICASDGLIVLSGVPIGGTWDVSTGIIDATGTINPAALGAGSFTVAYTYVDVNGCEGNADLTFDINAAPQASASAGGPYCVGDLAQLFGAVNTPGNASYFWMGPGGFTSTEQNPANVTDPGTYTLDVSVDGCPAQQVSVDLSFAPGPDATAANNGPYCRDDLIELFGGTTATGAVSYSWTGPAGFTSSEQNPLTPGSPGTYTLVVTADGCPSPPANTEVVVLDVPDASATNGGPYCENEAIQIFGSTLAPGSTITYSWTGPNGYTSSEQNPTDATEAGVYTLIVNVDGCTSPEAATNVLLTPSPVAIASNNGPVCYNSAVQLSGSTTTTGATIAYNWTGPNGYTSFEQNPSDATEPGTYLLQVIVDGCAADPVSTEVMITNAPDALAENDGPYCPDNPMINLSGSTPNFGTQIIYDWTGPNGYTSAEQNPSTATEPGTYTLIVTVDGCPSFATTTEVTFQQAPMPNIAGGAPFCEGQSTQLDGGLGYVDYQWSGGLTGQFVEISSPGTYFLTVTDGNGCTGTNSIAVNTLPLPTTTIAGNTVFCEGLSTILNAGSGFANYAWSNGLSGQAIEISFPDIYVLTITDNNGCTNTASVEVTVNENPEPSIAGSLTFCLGTTTTLDAGDGYSTYTWSDNSSGQQLEVSAPGTYGVTVSNASGCTGTASVEVTQNQALDPQIVGDADFCQGDNTVLDVGAGFSSYTWSNGLNDPSITVSTPGNYEVTVTDASGCSGTATIEVMVNDLPVVGISGNNPICSGQAITLDAGAGFAAYTWGPGNNNQTLEVTANGTYTVTVTDANGCSGTASTLVVENPNPIPSISGPTDFCAGNSIALEVDGIYNTYQWSAGSTTATQEVTMSGTYLVTVTDENGCTGTADYEVIQNPTPIVTINGNAPFCSGDMVVLDAGDDFVNYSWTGGSSNSTLAVNAGGNYQVTVTTAVGCTGIGEVAVVENPNPVPSINGPTEFCVGTIATLSANGTYAGYQWSGGGTEADLAVSLAGTYSLTVTDINGCSGIADFSIAESPALQPTISGPLDFCEGTTATLNAEGGFLSYEWSGGVVGSSLEVSSPGIYTVTVADASGCTGVADFDIVQNANPQVTINGINPICTGETLTLDAGPGFVNYQWSDNSLNQTLEASNSGIYEVTVTDANGCVGIGTTTVIENPNPVPQISGPAAFCASSTAILNAGNAYTNYLWSDGSQAATLEVFVTGTYEVTVTDINGCTGVADFSIQQNPLPNPSIAGSTTFCAGNSTILDAGTGFDQYIWSDGSDAATLTVALPGIYALTVTDVNGCTGTTSVEATESESLNPVISGVLDFCVGDNTELDAGTGFNQYVWSDGSANQTLEVDQAGIYAVTVADDSGCTGVTQVTVTENALPVLDILE
ncbi:MAG: hypothetical protein AAGD05_01185, partial [Bacteroidota bacterium]